ncbi:hypothetical protein [Flavobacterium sp. N2155]|nr:hypothetical protein [Flavobacterium sp. N2155]
MSNENLIVKLFEIDKQAEYFFKNFRFDNGDELPLNYQEKYTLNASILNSIKLIQTNPILKSKLLKNKATGFWKKISIQVNLAKNGLNHNLPSNERRIKGSYISYLEQGYNSLISKRFGSQNSRKVDEKVLKLLEDIVKQFKSDSPTLIKLKLDSFLEGNIQVIDAESGGLYNNEDFKGLNISTGAIKNNHLSEKEIQQYDSYQLLKKEMYLSNNFYDCFSKLDIEIRIKLLEQFLSLVDLVKKK